MSASVNRRIGLRNEEILLAISSKIFDLIGHAALVPLTIGRFDKAELIDARKGAHRTNQANVWTFRCFNGTNAPVMGWMNIAHLEPGTLPAEATRPTSRQTALVRRFCERIRLIHELRKPRPGKA